MSKYKFLPAVAVFLRFLGSVSAAVFAALHCGMIWSSPTVAEERVPCTGGQLIADKIVPVEGGGVAVELGAQKFLSPKSELCRHVARVYAREPELARRLPWSVYVPVVAQMAVGPDGDIARLAVQGVIESQTLSDEEVLTFFRGLSAAPTGAALLAGQILQLQSGSQVNRGAVCRALPFLPKNQLNLLRERIKSELRWIAARCLKEVVEQGRKSLSENRIEESAAAFEVVTYLFGQDGQAARPAQIALDRLRAVQDALASGTAGQLEAALRVAAFDVTIGEAISRLRPRIVQEFAQRKIVDSQPGATLRGLASLDFSQRNTSHHELLLKAIDQVTIKDADAFEDENVRRMLCSYASKDEIVKSHSLERLGSLIREDAKFAEGRSSNVLMGIVQEIRSDPSEDNDDLRLVIAKAMLESGNLPEAERVLGEIRTARPMIIRARLFARQHPIVIPAVAIIASIAVWTFVLIGRRGSGRKRKSGADERKGDSKAEHVGSHSLAKSSYTDFDEYGECLSKFSLKKGASLSEIKLAYRNAVKSFHPDLNPNASRGDIDKFIQLTKFYERLTELHLSRDQDPEAK